MGLHSHMRHNDQTLDVRQSHIALLSSPESFCFQVKMVSTSVCISRDGKNSRGVGIHLSKSVNSPLSKSVNSPARLAGQIREAWATYSRHCQDNINKKRRAIFRIQVTRLHIPQEDCLIDQLATWVIPGKVQGDQMGNMVVTIRGVGPRLSGYLEQGNIDQTFECYARAAIHTRARWWEHT